MSTAAFQTEIGSFQFNHCKGKAKFNFSDTNVCRWSLVNCPDSADLLEWTELHCPAGGGHYISKCRTTLFHMTRIGDAANATIVSISTFPQTKNKEPQPMITTSQPARSHYITKLPAPPAWWGRHGWICCDTFWCDLAPTLILWPLVTQSAPKIESRRYPNMNVKWSELDPILKKKPHIPLKRRDMKNKQL